MTILTDRFVTGFRRMEEGLRESTETSRRRAEEIEKLMNVVPVAIWVAYDPDCRLITGNLTADKFYEAGADENVSAGPTSGSEWEKTRRFFRDGKELRPEELPMQESVRKNIEVRDADLEVLLPSGRKISILGNARPLLDSSGKVRGSVASFIDITERKKAENELKASRRALADIIDFLPMPSRGYGGRVVAWNKAIEKMTGEQGGDRRPGRSCGLDPPYGIRRSMLLDLLVLEDEEPRRSTIMWLGAGIPCFGNILQRPPTETGACLGQRHFGSTTAR
jgi:PAS domain-containing protein